MTRQAIAVQVRGVEDARVPRVLGRLCFAGSVRQRSGLGRLGAEGRRARGRGPGPARAPSKCAIAFADCAHEEPDAAQQHERATGRRFAALRRRPQTAIRRFPISASRRERCSPTPGYQCIPSAPVARRPARRRPRRCRDAVPDPTCSISDFGAC